MHVLGSVTEIDQMNKRSLRERVWSIIKDLPKSKLPESFLVVSFKKYSEKIPETFLGSKIIQERIMKKFRKISELKYIKNITETFTSLKKVRKNSRKILRHKKYSEKNSKKFLSSKSF